MRRRPAPPPSAEKMIRDYLGRLSVAATKMLPTGDRRLFVARIRAAIEAKVGPLASAGAEDVLNALNTLGDPDELAKRERERLYSARRRGAAAAPPALWKPSKESRRGAAPPPPPARRPGPGQERKTRSWPHRGLAGPDEPRPAESVPPSPAPEPVPAVPAVPRPAGSPEVTTASAAEAPPAETFPAQTSPAGKFPAGTPSEQASRQQVPSAQAFEDGAPADLPPTAGAHPASVPTPDPAGLEADAPEPGAPERVGPEQGGPESGAAEQGGPEPRAAESGGPEQNGTPPGWLRPTRPAPAPAETKPTSIVPGMTQSGEAEESPLAKRRSPTVAPLAEAWALARKHPLEAVAVVLLGLGGLILPFPFWLIGGLVSLRSRRWDARDKWMALAGPLLLTFAVLLIRAGTSSGNYFSAFYHAFGHDFWPSIRAGCVLCAAYLIWRLRRGPRLRTVAPWQRPR